MQNKVQMNPNSHLAFPSSLPWTVTHMCRYHARKPLPQSLFGALGKCTSALLTQASEFMSSSREMCGNILTPVFFMVTEQTRFHVCFLHELSTTKKLTFRKYISVYSRNQQCIYSQVADIASYTRNIQTHEFKEGGGEGNHSSQKHNIQKSQVSVYLWSDIV